MISGLERQADKSEENPFGSSGTSYVLVNVNWWIKIRTSPSPMVQKLAASLDVAFLHGFFISYPAQWNSNLMSAPIYLESRNDSCQIFITVFAIQLIPQVTDEMVSSKYFVTLSFWDSSCYFSSNRWWRELPKKFNKNISKILFMVLYIFHIYYTYMVLYIFIALI